MIMFQIITASFLAVALMANTLPFLKLMRLKKLDSGVSFRFQIALAALRKAIFNRLLPLGTLWLSTLPALILLLGASRSHDANCLALLNFFNPLCIMQITITVLVRET